jgi:3-dehydroquinate synthase
MTSTLTQTSPWQEKRTQVYIGQEHQNIVLAHVKGRVAIISDSHVAPLHGENLVHFLRNSGVDSQLFLVPAGESSKTRAMKEKLESEMLESGFDRKSSVIALGGGVITDLAGFLASTFCRGIPLLMIPSSLLAAVDSSIGGKTGVNTPQGKNLIGSTYQADAVIIDLNILKTQPALRYREGIAEIIKAALIASPSLFQELHDHADALLNKEQKVLASIIKTSCQIKINIVEKDEKETGLRRVLNAGHTVAHALEKLSDYQLAHGDAVAVGLVIEAAMAQLMNRLDYSGLEKIVQIVKRFGFDLSIIKKWNAESLYSAMKSDKKCDSEGRPRFVILEEIGKVASFDGKYCCTASLEVLTQAINLTEKLLSTLLGTKSR